jgi:GcrA cell cycle regulator
MKDSALTMVSGAQPMGWTEERVDLLKKLWMEGLSASQIAAELGEGVTRNAVIGKVHRLKLSARAKPTSAPARPRPTQRTAPRRPATPGAGSSLSSGMSGGMNKPRQGGGVMRTQTMGATALAATPEMETQTYVAPDLRELHIPEDQRLSLLQLSEATCKWPIGDPLTKDFYFCGQHSLESGPYCDFHARLAYHQVERKKR